MQLLIDLRRAVELCGLLFGRDDAERLFEPSRGFQAGGAGEATGLYGRLAARRDDDFNGLGHVAAFG